MVHQLLAIEGFPEKGKTEIKLTSKVKVSRYEQRTIN
jgi:hypothetical protein